MVLLEPGLEITKVVAFKKDTVGNFVRAPIDWKTQQLKTHWVGMKADQIIIGKKNSKLRYRSPGNTQTKY